MKPVLFIAGGGTGGHVYPGLAVASALRELADVEVVFVGTSRGLEARVVPTHGFALETLHVEPMKGGGLRRSIRGGMIAAGAMWNCRALLRKYKPRAVLSIGGYAGGPVALAAALSGIPMAIVEPNAVFGFTNKMLEPFTRRVYCAWDGVARIAKGRARTFGVPIRPAFVAAEYAVAAPLAILILGGSQGAGPLNRDIPPALVALAETRTISVVHQTGKNEVEEVRARYGEHPNLDIAVTPFIDDVAGALQRSHLVIARSGASSVAEISAVGRPAILIPFPQAADDHQTRNAERLSAAGGALLVPQRELATGGLTAALTALLENNSALAHAAAFSRLSGKPNAAAAVALDLLTLAGISALTRDPMDVFST